MHSPALHTAAPPPVADSEGYAPPSIPSWWIWALGLLIVVAYFVMLPGYPLGEPDEGRYAEIPREMLVLHDWVTPHVNYTKYFEKPPLMYWLTAVTEQLFGTGEGVVRLWTAVFGVLGIVVAYGLGGAMYGRWVGAASALLLAATPLYFGMSQVLTLDMAVTALITVALAAFWFAYTDVTHRRRHLLVLSAATALAVLTKGPVAIVLPGGIIAAFLLLRRNLTAVRWIASPAAIGLFLLIALPWFVLVSYRNPEFVRFFVINQHFDRYVRPAEHVQPIYFFVPFVLSGMLPWSAVYLLAPRSVAAFLSRLTTGHVSAAALYCSLWAGIVFVFFSLSGSKLATYILPMFCPLAILAARFFEHEIGHGRASAIRRGALVLLVIGMILLIAAIVAGEIVDLWHMQIILPRAYAGALVLLLAGLVALRQVQRGGKDPQRLQGAVVTLAIGTLALQMVIISGREVARHDRPIGLAIRAQAAPEDLAILYRHYSHTIVFYAQRRFVLIGGRGELEFGSRQGDQRAFFWDTDAELLEAWRSSRHIFLVVERDELDALRPQLRPPPRQLASFRSKVILVNFDAHD